MITKIKESEALQLSATDIARYLDTTRKVNVLYASRSVLEIRQRGDSTAGGDASAGYTVVFKNYDPLGCCDDWTLVGTQHFSVAEKERAIEYFMGYLRSNPDA